MGSTIDILLETLKSWKEFNDRPKNKSAKKLSNKVLILYERAIDILEN